MNKLFAILVLVSFSGYTLIAASAAQAAPTATMASGDTFAQYAGSATLGNNNVNINNTLFWIYESTVNYSGQQVDSWFLFFDPMFGTVEGLVDFGKDIVYIADKQDALVATSSFQSPSFSYDYSNPFIGLEFFNKLSTDVSGSTIDLMWAAISPGDHIRVLTVSNVPEPSTYALMLAGLGAAGFLNKRRRAMRKIILGTTF